MSLPFTSLSGVSVIGAGTSRDLERLCRQFTMVVSGTSGGGFTIVLEGSHDGTAWVSLATSGGTPTAVTVSTHWVRHIRANLTTLYGGPSPTVTATIAVGDEDEED